jgi:hypothetical protein
LGGFVQVPPDEPPRSGAVVDIGHPTDRQDGLTALRPWRSRRPLPPFRGDAAAGRRCGLLQHTERRTDMYTLTFNDNERTLLIDVLEAFLAKLPHQIHQTDSRKYRDKLDEKQNALQQLLKRLQHS